VLRLSQGLKPGRPLARPIDDQHWTLIERCLSSIPERPLAEDVVSSLQQLLEACTLLPPPLRELLGVPTPSPTGPNHPGCHPPFEDARDRAEELSRERAKVGYPHSNPSGGSAKPKHGLRGEDTVSQEKPTSSERVIDARSDSPPGGLNRPIHWASIQPSLTVISNWLRGTLLGKGTYGRVYLAMDTSTGEMFAVKQVERALAQNLILSELKTERDILRGLNRPHIVAYLGAEDTPTFLNTYVVFFARERQRHSSMADSWNTSLAGPLRVV
jgi:hypothetical protein